MDALGNVSDPLSSTTAFVPDVTAPLAPEANSFQLGLDATSSESDTLRWAASKDNCQLSSYEFAIGTDIDTDTGLSNKLPWTDVGQNLAYQATGAYLGPDPHHSSVRAIDAAGNTSPATSSAAWVIKPEATSNLEYIERTSSSLELGWTTPEDHGYEITDYAVEYKETSSSTWIAFTDTVGASTSAIVSGLKPSTSYDIRIKALNGRYSNPSNILTDFTGSNVPFFNPTTYNVFNLGGADDSTVVAYEDQTEIKINGTLLVELDAGETHRFASALNDEMQSNKPVFVAGKAQGSGTTSNYIANVVWNIPAWSGKIFSFSGTRSPNHVVNIRAFEETKVEIFSSSSGAPLQTQTMTANTNHTFSVPNGSYRIESTGLITGYLYSSENGLRVDAMPLLPASTDLIGYPSRNGNISSLADGNSYSLIGSNSNTATTGTLNQFSTLTVQATGTLTSLYRSDALRILSAETMVARRNADADGWASAPFSPRVFMRKRYALNVNADYVAFASDKPAVIEFINPANGSVASTVTLTKTGNHPLAPYKGYTNVYDLAGYIFKSDTAFAAWYQPNSNNGGGDQDETTMFGTND